MTSLRHRRWHRPRLHPGCLLIIALVLLMFVYALAWVRSHAPAPEQLRAVAGTQR